MSVFKLQFDSVHELVSYFLINEINLAVPCDIRINSIYDWVSNTNFQIPDLESVQTNTVKSVQNEHPRGR